MKNVQFNKLTGVLTIEEITPSELNQILNDVTISNALAKGQSPEAKMIETVSKVGTTIKSRKQVHRPNVPWTVSDMGTIARMLQEALPYKKNVVPSVARVLTERPGNVRTFTTNKAMVYNIVRWLREGEQTSSMANKTIADLEQAGYTRGCLQPVKTNMLGDVRQIAVQEA